MYDLSNESSWVTPIEPLFDKIDLDSPSLELFHLGDGLGHIAAESIDFSKQQKIDLMPMHLSESFKLLINGSVFEIFRGIIFLKLSNNFESMRIAEPMQGISLVVETLTNFSLFCGAHPSVQNCPFALQILHH